MALYVTVNVRQTVSFETSKYTLAIEAIMNELKLAPYVAKSLNPVVPTLVNVTVC
jgi:hypothetical protein